MATLSIKDISKSFGNAQALEGISFDVEESEIVALLGPSGSGKSTLLMIIAGLESADQGDICWDGKSLKGTPSYLRQFGLMFQDFALFPHMNVDMNIAFGLKMAHMDIVRIKERVQEMLELVGLSGFAKRDVNTLSGGEQQRVSLARALAPNPRLLMLDEPLGSLDSNLRERLVTDLHRILLQMHQRAIYVTHDQEEAFAIASRVIILNSGRIEQIGTPQEIYSNPATLFVARFLDMTNFIPGEIKYLDGRYQVITSLGNFPVNSYQPGEVTVLLRPDLVRLDDNGPIKLNGVLKDVSFRGSVHRITLVSDLFTLIFEFPSMVSLPKPGTTITLSIDPTSAIKIFPKY